MAAHSADVPAAGTARGSGWGRGARSSDMPRSPRGERGPLRPPIAWQEASQAGAAQLAGRPASENKCENVCEVACEVAREAACAIAPENACEAAPRGCTRECSRHRTRYRARSRVATRGGSPRDSLTRRDSLCVRSHTDTHSHSHTLCVTPSYWGKPHPSLHRR